MDTHAPPPPCSPRYEFVSGAVEATQGFGERVGRLLRAGDVVALTGELGSGKTTLIQGIAAGLGCQPERVKSPTFVLMREYHGVVPVVHLDAYRLDGAQDVSWLDLDLILGSQQVTLIEWAERMTSVLPDEHIAIHLSHVSAHRRRLCLEPLTTRAQELVAALTATPHADSRD